MKKGFLFFSYTVILVVISLSIANDGYAQACATEQANESQAKQATAEPSTQAQPQLKYGENYTYKGLPPTHGDLNSLPIRCELKLEDKPEQPLSKVVMILISAVFGALFSGVFSYFFAKRSKYRADAIQIVHEMFARHHIYADALGILAKLDVIPLAEATKCANQLHEFIEVANFWAQYGFNHKVVREIYMELGVHGFLHDVYQEIHTKQKPENFPVWPEYPGLEQYCERYKND